MRHPDFWDRHLENRRTAAELGLVLYYFWPVVALGLPGIIIFLLYTGMNWP